MTKNEVFMKSDWTSAHNFQPFKLNHPSRATFMFYKPCSNIENAQMTEKINNDLNIFVRNSNGYV